MTESEHPALRFAGPLKDLAEGRTDPEDWLAWWNAHADEFESACPRGWFLKVKPRQLNSGVNCATLGSQGGAIAVLEALNVPFVHSDRYQRAWKEDFERFCAAEKARKELLAKEFEPALSAFASAFPKFARFLKKRAVDIDRLSQPATEAEIAAMEHALEIVLPTTFKTFLKCTSALDIDYLFIGLEHVDRHPAVVERQSQSTPTICIAEYWLEADGDQVVIEQCTEPLDDPPVYYYAHSADSNKARKLSSSFTNWIESLPRSPVFRK